ncbi:5'/3'-nucleotidase SurE [Clostridium aminobutyricum]|uniref:5'-nucleotidase SurE n=1 Tax=Clostridium aminobutyricum TaxID=33953 RepID=A0A939D8I2_CLOAM|nr:5'/3'-nucleotidase SurE [Clostridium aminobutyricum]MBN7773091.1 5'/3'-nucleotidase SurE [Clostridium aminobutyricum]
MNILISNDDGIHARGIMELTRSLSQAANVYVCAPHVERSAAGHSITVRAGLEVNKVPYEYAKLAYEINGTPADCVKLGILLLKDKGIPVDMVFSGINHGGNMGTDTHYSGTVSAAIEGCICGIPSVAVSVNHHKPQYFETAGEIAIRALQKATGKLDAKTVLNINVPDIPKQHLKGIRITRLGPREYDGWFRKESVQGEERSVTQYWYSGKPVIYNDLPEDYDVIAVQDGYASITPLQFDFTNHQLIEEVKKWGIL